MFFYSSTRFALVYGDNSDASETTARLYDVIVNKNSPRTHIGSVKFDRIHPNLVTGGYYRDEVITIGSVTSRYVIIIDGKRYDSDFTVDGLGNKSVGAGADFDKEKVREEAKEMFSNPLTDYRLSDENQAGVRAWPKNTFSVAGTTYIFSESRTYHYRFNVTYSISSEAKEAVYYKSDYKDGYTIMART